MPMWGSLGFQDSASYIMEHLVFFHDHSMLVLTLVSVLVLYFVVVSGFLGVFDRYVSESHTVEFVWTVLPAFFLVFIAFPSLSVLYLIDEGVGGFLTYSTVGHQWYWSYEYSDFSGGEFDSFMSSSEVFRLVDCEDRLCVPLLTPVRMLVSSQDVIHSWTVPSFGVKADAVPGRINQLFFMPSRPGYFVGQCSEICGSNHSFMPISLEVLGVSDFVSYMNLLD